MDVVRSILAFNAGRDPELLELKYLRLRSNAFAFLRGTCHRFYEQLPRAGVLKTEPLAWACGDLHFENFGSYKGDNHLVYFDINDFDESALAPVSCDLMRLLASLRVGADDLGIGRREAGKVCAELVKAYAGALTQGKAYWVERDNAQDPVRSLLENLRQRTRAQFLAERTLRKGRRRVLRVDGKKALPASDAQRTLVTSFMDDFARAQPDPDFYAVLDVARRIAGTGSLGLERYVILVRGKGAPDGNYLLDLKQAQPSSLRAFVKGTQPRWQTEAQRIVTVQQRMQAVPAAFLQSVLIDERPFVLRGLQPSADRVALDRGRQALDGLTDLAPTLGRLVAWAQLRSAGRQGSATADELIDFGRRDKWKARLLDVSQDCAAQVRKDAAAFNAAFDDGAVQA